MKNKITSSSRFPAIIPSGLKEIKWYAAVTIVTSLFVFLAFHLPFPSTDSNGRLFSIANSLLQENTYCLAAGGIPELPERNYPYITLPAPAYPVNPFNFAYFARSSIHLDSHNIPATVTVPGNLWTNGEFELDKNIIMRAGTGTFMAAGGHVQIAGTVYGNIYAPSIDTYGPDGEGFNSATDCALSLGCWGTVYGDVYLIDGYFVNPDYDPLLSSQPLFLFRDPDATMPRALTVYEQEYYCADGGPYGNCIDHVTPLYYGLYATVAATHAGRKPGDGCTPVVDPPNNYYRPGVQDCVVACSEDAPPMGESCNNIRDNPDTPAVTEGYIISYSGFGPFTTPDAPYDPNADPRIAYLLPDRGGKVLLHRDLPIINWQLLYDKAVADKTVLPPTCYNRSLYMLGERDLCSWTDEPPWFNPVDCDPSNSYTEQFNIGGTAYVSIGRRSGPDYQPTIWYIGDGPEYDTNGELILSSVQDLSGVGPPSAYSVLWLLRDNYYPLGAVTRGVIIHGAIVMEGQMLAPRDAGCHIYGCGHYDYFDENANAVYDPGVDALGHDPSQWQSTPPNEPVKTGNFPEDLVCWMNMFRFYPNQGPVIPYSVPALISGSDGGSVFATDSDAAIKFIDRKVGPQYDNPKTEFMFIHGALFSYGQIYIHQPYEDRDVEPPPMGDGIEETRQINSSYFIYGSQVANVIHNNRYTAFEYDSCVQSYVKDYAEFLIAPKNDFAETIAWKTITDK